MHGLFNQTGYYFFFGLDSSLTVDALLVEYALLSILLPMVSITFCAIAYNIHHILYLEFVASSCFFPNCSLSSREICLVVYAIAQGIHHILRHCPWHPSHSSPWVCCKFMFSLFPHTLHALWRVVVVILQYLFSVKVITHFCSFSIIFFYLVSQYLFHVKVATHFS